MSDIEIEIPTSLRYTFKQSLDYLPVTKYCKPNYLIAGLIYNNSLLEENLEAQPFPYLEDGRLKNELRKTQYFLQGTELTVVRRIEDFVAIDYEPSLIDLPDHHRLAPVSNRLKRQVAYLEQQVEKLPETIFKSWIKAHNEHLFKHPKELGVDHSVVVERLYHQIQLESTRYLTLNKYHLLQQVKLEYDLEYWELSCLYNTWQRFSLPVKNRVEHRLERLDPSTSYLFDFGNIIEERLPRWTKRDWQERNHYPFTELRTARSVDWLNTTLTACTRWVYSDLEIDTEEIRLEKREHRTDIACCLNQHW